MKITKDNYEPFFLDFLEGNLEENQIDQFLDFLEQNPDLKEELQLVETMRLPEEHFVFSGKNQLYKSVADRNVAAEIRIIAYLEGDMENEERKSFETYLDNNPEFKEEYNLFAKTRLIPDIKLNYRKKHRLYRKSGFTIAMNWFGRVAAIVILLWGINAIYHSENQTFPQKSGPELADNKMNTEPSVKKPEVIQKNQTKEIQEINKPFKEIKSVKNKSIREQNKGRLEEEKTVSSPETQRDLTALSVIQPIKAHFSNKPVEIQLAVSTVSSQSEINNLYKVLTVDEYLVDRAKRAGNEGIVSAKRMARLGLGLVSELSGEIIGYSETNGKITSVDFESKLFAFSIPIQKK